MCRNFSLARNEYQRVEGFPICSSLVVVLQAESCMLALLNGSCYFSVRTVHLGSFVTQGDRIVHYFLKIYSRFFKA